MQSDAAKHEGKHLILYDGVCGLCNRFNIFVLRRDRRALFRFAPLQSDLARNILANFRLYPDELDTFYVIAKYRSTTPRALSKARAALFVGRELGGIWKASVLLGILPDFVLNAFYDMIARNRYRLFGGYDQCPVPKPEYRDRFENPDI